MDIAVLWATLFGKLTLTLMHDRMWTTVRSVPVDWLEVLDTSTASLSLDLCLGSEAEHPDQLAQCVE